MADPIALEAIGTRWKIHIPEELPPERRAALLRLVEERIEAFDRSYSRFRDDSLVTRLSREAGTYRFPDDAWPTMDAYERVYRLTGGAFTPLIGQTMAEAGYDARYSLVPKTLHVPPAWDDVLEYRHPFLTLRRPVLLDFGAGGKGYLADLVAEVLRDAGIRAFCVDAGGDIVCRGPEPTRIALEDPENVDRAIGVATVANGSVCGSAGNRRAWATFHHTIDPRTLASPRHVLATWAFAPAGLLADALATCLYLVEPEELQKEFAFEYAVMYPDRTVRRSAGAPVEIFE